MQSQDSSICKYNQYGFCKYRKSCKDFHVSEVCEHTTCENNSCIKRQPKFNTGNGCRFKDCCAYKHTEKLASNQSEINKAVAEVTVKHEDEIKTLKDEMYNMKITVKAMEDKIQSLMNELKEQNQTNKEVEIIENVLSHKNKDTHTSDEEPGPKTVNNKKETILKCDICKQQFKTEKKNFF